MVLVGGGEWGELGVWPRATDLRVHLRRAGQVAAVVGQVPTVDGLERKKEQIDVDTGDVCVCVSVCVCVCVCVCVLLTLCMS